MGLKNKQITEKVQASGVAGGLRGCDLLAQVTRHFEQEP